MRFFNIKKKTADNFLKADGAKSRPRFHTLTISDVRRETDDCVSVAFEVPDDLKNDYRFLPGQYLTLRTTIDGEDIRRSYSICSSPLNESLRVAIKKLEGGKFSTYANEHFAPGQSLEVMTPEGNFTTNITEGNAKNYVAFAAGSGITPIMSLMKTILALEPKSTFTLFFGNRTSNSIIFRDTIDELKNTYMNRLRVHHVLSREDQGTDLLKGHIDDAKCRAYADRFFDAKGVDKFFICGPEGMIVTVDAALKDLGVANENIIFELFTTSSKTEATGVNDSGSKVKSKADGTSSVTVILDGEETHFDLAYDGDNIVDAAMEAGSDVPFSCKGAVCCTCRARVLEGEVEMDMNYALEPDEVEDGYVLTCQTHPRSPKVVISFDE